MAKIIKSDEALPDTVWKFERDTLEEILPPEPVINDDEGVDDGSAQVSLEEELAREKDVIIAEARAEAERKIQEAYAEGLRRGEEAGRKAYLESVGESATVLRAAAEAMQQSRQLFLDNLEPQVVELAKLIVERILHREMEGDVGLLKRTVHAALAKLIERERVRIRVNPEDIAALRREKVALLEEFDGVEAIDVVADPDVSTGGCIVESQTLHIDARTDAQLQALLDALDD